MWLAEMVAEPILGLTDDRVCVRLSSDKASVGQLAVAMPLQKIHFGNVQRFARTAVTRNDVDRQVVPRGRTARGHDPSTLIRKKRYLVQE